MISTANRSPRRGAIMALFVLLLPVLIVMVGFSIDFAQMQRVRTELRRSTDLAAKAASATLANTSDEAAALAVAQEIALANDVAGQPLTLAAENVIFGNSSRQFDGTFSFSPGGFPVNAVRVVGDRTIGSADGGVKTYFGRLYNSPFFEPKLSAVSAFVNSDICLVLDRSSSMKLAVDDTEPGMYSTDPRMCAAPFSDCRWIALETAVNSFLDTMDSSRSAEQVGVVTFASDFTICSTTSARVSVDQGLSSNLASTRTAMAIRSSSIWNGNTDIAGGIEEGQRMLLGAGSRPTAVKFMIVMTDGRYTEDDPIPYASTAAANGIEIHTITFGVGANQPDMQRVADVGNGRHYHADTTADLVSVFEDLGGSISNLVQ